MRKTKVNYAIDEEIEQRFRKAVFERKGMKKGNISESLEEAMGDWIEKD